MPLIVHTNKKRVIRLGNYEKVQMAHIKTVSYFILKTFCDANESDATENEHVHRIHSAFLECAFVECHFLLAPIFFAFIVIFVCCIPFYLHLTRMLSAWTATVRPYLEWMLHWLFVVIQLLFLLILSICFSRFIFFLHERNEEANIKFNHSAVVLFNP